MAGTASQDEIRMVLEDMLAAINAGDAERLRSTLSKRLGAVHIGTDAEEWWTAKLLLDTAGAELRGKKDIQVIPGDLDVHEQGDIAWIEARGRFKRADGTEQPVRMTGVLVREDGHWKIAQSHASVADQYVDPPAPPG